MAETIKSEFGIAPVMIEGRGGVFDVKLDDQLIYSKHETGQFPEHALIVENLEKRLPK